MNKLSDPLLGTSGVVPEVATDPKESGGYTPPTTDGDKFSIVQHGPSQPSQPSQPRDPR